MLSLDDLELDNSSIFIVVKNYEGTFHSNWQGDWWRCSNSS